MVFAEGVRAGLVLAACVVVLAILGLDPSMSWVPEVPLLAVGAAAARLSQRTSRV